MKDLELTPQQIAEGLSGEAGPWGLLTWATPDGKRGRYQLTDLDVLWACRMCVGERGDEALEVLQTMAQRFVGVGAWASLAALFLAYSQPINPRHRREANPAREGQPYYETHRLDRRAFLASASLEDLRTARSEPMGRQGVELALAWCRGAAASALVPGAVHFAIKSLVVNDHLGGNPSSPLAVYKAGNWFAAKPWSRNWPADAVRVVPPGAHEAAQAPVRQPGASTPPREPAAPPPGRKARVVALQEFLAAQGYDPGPLDGIAGPKTRKALADARKDAEALEGLAAQADLGGRG